MANQVEIANLALARVGSAPIMSLGDTDDENARISNRFYEQAVKETLRAHQWSSATKRASLARLTDAPDFGYTFQYTLPLDFVRAIALNGQTIHAPVEYWSIEGENLLTDEETADLIYIFYSEDTTIYDDLLIEAIYINLASRIGPVLTGQPALGKDLLNEYEIVLARAKTSDAQETGSNENHPIVSIMQRSPIINRRRYSILG